MCYTCGCGRLDDNMGDPRNITNKTFEEAAEADRKSVDQVKKNTLDALQKSIEAQK